MKIHQKYVHQKETKRNKKDQRNELKEAGLQQHKSRFYETPLVRKRTASLKTYYIKFRTRTSLIK